MNESSNLLIGGADGRPVVQLPGMSSRHGLIAGATGTGKTVTLQVLAEGFSRLGVPVFAADIKGDLSGLAAAGKPHPRIEQRLQKIPLANYVQRSAPVLLWDVFGEKGHPIRATISEMGPLLLSNLLDLNETQSGVLFMPASASRTTRAWCCSTSRICAPCWPGQGNMPESCAPPAATSPRAVSAPSSGGCWFWKKKGAITFSASRP
jgi:hypothetical protein